MNVVKKIIPEEVVRTIEALSFEYESRKDIIKEMLAMDMDTSTPAFIKYQREAVDFKAQFEAAKVELQKTYVDIVDGAQRWTLDYASNELSIVVA